MLDPFVITPAKLSALFFSSVVNAVLFFFLSVVLRHVEQTNNDKTIYLFIYLFISDQNDPYKTMKEHKIIQQTRKQTHTR